MYAWVADDAGKSRLDEHAGLVIIRVLVRVVLVLVVVDDA